MKILIEIEIKEDQSFQLNKEDLRRLPQNTRDHLNVWLGSYLDTHWMPGSLNGSVTIKELDRE